MPGPDGVDALLFDLGGVLIDVDFDRTLAAWAAAAGCDLAALSGRFTFDDAYCQHERGEIDAARVLRLATRQPRAGAVRR